MSLEVEQLANGGVNGPALVRRTPFRDGRGQFSRLFAREELAAAGLGFEIVHVSRPQPYLYSPPRSAQDSHKASPSDLKTSSNWGRSESATPSWPIFATIAI